MSYYEKYLKYKNKYILLKQGGSNEGKGTNINQSSRPNTNQSLRFNRNQDTESSERSLSNKSHSNPLLTRQFDNTFVFPSTLLQLLIIYPKLLKKQENQDVGMIVEQIQKPIEESDEHNPWTNQLLFKYKNYFIVARNFFSIKNQELNNNKAYNYFIRYTVESDKQKYILDESIIYSFITEYYKRGPISKKIHQRLPPKDHNGVLLIEEIKNMITNYNEAIENEKKRILLSTPDTWNNNNINKIRSELLKNTINPTNEDIWDVVDNMIVNHNNKNVDNVSKKIKNLAKINVIDKISFNTLNGCNAYPDNGEMSLYTSDYLKLYLTYTSILNINHEKISPSMVFVEDFLKNNPDFVSNNVIRKDWIQNNTDIFKNDTDIFKNWVKSLRYNSALKNEDCYLTHIVTNKNNNEEVTISELNFRNIYGYLNKEIQNPNYKCKFCQNYNEKTKCNLPLNHFTFIDDVYCILLKEIDISETNTIKNINIIINGNPNIDLIIPEKNKEEGTYYFITKRKYTNLNHYIISFDDFNNNYKNEILNYCTEMHKLSQRQKAYKKHNETLIKSGKDENKLKETNIKIKNTIRKLDNRLIKIENIESLTKVGNFLTKDFLLITSTCPYIVNNVEAIIKLHHDIYYETFGRFTDYENEIRQKLHKLPEIQKEIVNKQVLVDEYDNYAITNEARFVNLNDTRIQLLNKEMGEKKKEEYIKRHQPNINKQPERTSVRKHKLLDEVNYELALVTYNEYLNNCNFNLFNYVNTDFYKFLGEDGLQSDELYDLNNKFIWTLTNNNNTICKNILQYHVLIKNTNQLEYDGINSDNIKTKLIISDNKLLNKIKVYTNNGKQIDNFDKLKKTMKNITNYKDITGKIPNVFIAFTFLEEDEIVYLINLRDFLDIIYNKIIEMSNRVNDTYENIQKKIMENNVENKLTDDERNLLLIKGVYNNVEKILSNIFNNDMLQVIFNRHQVNFKNVVNKNVNTTNQTNNKNFLLNLNDNINKYYKEKMDTINSQGSVIYTNEMIKMFRKYTYEQSVIDDIKTLISNTIDTVFGSSDNTNLKNETINKLLVENVDNYDNYEDELTNEKINIKIHNYIKNIIESATTKYNNIKQTIEKLIIEGIYNNYQQVEKLNKEFITDNIDLQKYNINTKDIENYKNTYTTKLLEIINDDINKKVSINLNKFPNIVKIISDVFKIIQKNSIEEIQNIYDLIDSLLDFDNLILKKLKNNENKINDLNKEFMDKIDEELKNRDEFYNNSELTNLKETYTNQLINIIGKNIRVIPNIVNTVINLSKNNNEVYIYIETLFKYIDLFNDIQDLITKKFGKYIESYDEVSDRSIPKEISISVSQIYDTFIEFNNTFKYYNKFYNSIPIIKKFNELHNKVIAENNYDNSFKQNTNKTKPTKPTKPIKPIKSIKPTTSKRYNVPNGNEILREELDNYKSTTDNYKSKGKGKQQNNEYDEDEDEDDVDPKYKYLGNLSRF